MNVDFSIEILRNISLAVILLTATIVDIRYKKIPNPVIFIMYLLGISLLTLNFDINIVRNNLLGFLVFGIVFLAIYFISKGQIGMGDVKLIAGIGLLLGLSRTMSVIMISLVLCAVFGVALIVFKKIKRDETLPFAPFLLVGFLIYVI